MIPKYIRQIWIPLSGFGYNDPGLEKAYYKAAGIKDRGAEF
jgi:hypothetical protein